MLVSKRFGCSAPKPPSNSTPLPLHHGILDHNISEMSSSTSSSHSFEGKTLLECFQAGRNIFKQLDDASIAGNDPRYRSVVATGIEALTSCLYLIAKTGMFSANEEVEDIKTTSLKYLLVPFYLGEIYMKVNDMDQRLEAVQKSQKLLKNFVENCLVLQLVPKEEAVIWERKGAVDGATQRGEKIARNKRKKEAEAALQMILKRKQTTHDGEELEEGMDEELEREVSLKSISVCVNQALDTLESAKQELEILQMMAQRRAQGLPPPKPEKPDPNVPREIKYFTVDKRLQVKENIFRPDWIQPTVTIEEAGMADYKEAMERSKRQKEGEEARKRKEEEKREYDSDEEEVKKQRDWDDWKDENKKGSGNRGNLGYKY